MKFKLIEHYEYYGICDKHDLESFVEKAKNELAEKNLELGIFSVEKIFKASSYIRIKRIIKNCFTSKIEYKNDSITDKIILKLKDEYVKNNCMVEIDISDDDCTVPVHYCPDCGIPYITEALVGVRDAGVDTVICKNCANKFNIKDVKLREITPGRYRYFNRNEYQVFGVAKNANNDAPNIPVVIYRTLYGDGELFYRNLVEFSSRVNKIKHPDATQEYRFERIGE